MILRKAAVVSRMDPSLATCAKIGSKLLKLSQTPLDRDTSNDLSRRGLNQDIYAIRDIVVVLAVRCHQNVSL